MTHFQTFSLFTILTILALVYHFKKIDKTPEPLKQLKSQMISKPAEHQDTVTHKLSEFYTEFIPADFEPEYFKYYSQLDGNNFIMLVEIPWINTHPLIDQEFVLDFIPNVLDLYDNLKDKNRYIGIYGDEGLAIAKTPKGEFYGKNAKQEMLMKYFAQ